MWCLYRIYQLNKRRCRCKWDASIEYLTRAIFEKQVTALHVVQMFHLFNRYVFILLKKMRTETKTVPSTWYIFNVQGCTRTDLCLKLFLAYMGNRPIFIGKSETLLSWLAICLLFWWFYLSSLSLLRKHTHQQKGRCLPNDLWSSYLQPTQPFFQFSSRRTHKFPYLTTAQK